MNCSVSRSRTDRGKQRLIGWILPTVVIGLLSSTTEAPAADSESWKQAYAKGEAAAANQDLVSAEQDYRKAYGLVASQNASPEDTAEVTRKLASVLALRDKTGEALELYGKLLVLQEKQYGRDSIKLAPVLFALGSIQEAAGDHDAAMVLYQRAVRINEKQWGPYSPEMGESLGRLARSAANVGKYDVSARHFKRAMAILSKQPGLEAANQLEAMIHDYADVLKHLDNSDSALIQDFKKDILKGALEDGSSGSRLSKASPSAGVAGQSAWRKQGDLAAGAGRKWQIEEDPKIVMRGLPDPGSDATLAPAFKVVENTIFKQDRFDKAEANYQRTIGTDIDSLGPNHPAVANDLIALAQLYITQLRYADAQPLLQRALPIYEQTYGASNPLTSKTKATLASVDLRLGDAQSAQQLYRSLLAGGQSALGPNSLETANVLNELAYLCYRDGKLQDAITFYGWALASAEGALGQKDPLVAACLQDYAQVLRTMGRTDEAAAAEMRAQQILSK